MKKILITSYSLNLGGIETALIQLIDKLVEMKNYEITLFLEKKEGIFLNQINSAVKIITLDDFRKNNKESKKNNKKRVDENESLNLNINSSNSLKIEKTLSEITSKVSESITIQKLINSVKNKYDSSIAYATYSKIGSKIARSASSNSSLFIHSDYSYIYSDPYENIKFLKGIGFEKFKNIVFVSETSKQNFLNMLIKNDNTKLTNNIVSKNLICIKNYIDKEKIIKKSKEVDVIENSEVDIINEAKNNNYKIFINVGRHNEHAKKLTRIIDSCIMLKEIGITNYLFIFVGDGEDRKLYEKQVKENNLEKNIVFFGEKVNPYPYYILADFVVVTSDYEGYPVVFMESQVLERKLITTDVSDSKKDIDNKTGIVIDKSEIALFECMKDIILENKSEYSKYRLLEKLNCKIDIRKYNQAIMQKLEQII